MSSSDPLAPLKAFRLRTVQLGLLLTALLTGAGLLFDRDLGVGVLLGGLGGIVMFWIVARRMAKVAADNPQVIQLGAFRWTALRMLVYALILYRAYTLDPESGYGLIGAVGGLLVVRLAMLILGFTGLDLTHQEK